MDEFSSLDRLKGLMEDWANWYRGCTNSNLGFKSRSAGIGGSGGDDFESMLGKVEADVCRLIDAAVDDLPPNQGCAIQHRYLASVYRFRDYAQALDAAHDRLLIELPKKGVVI